MVFDANHGDVVKGKALESEFQNGIRFDSEFQAGNIIGTDERLRVKSIRNLTLTFFFNRFQSK